MAGNRQSKKGFSWVGLIACIVVMALLVGFMGWATNGFTDWSFRFGNNVEQDNSEKDNPTQEAPGGMEIVVNNKDIGETGVQLMTARIMRSEYAAYGISEQADSAYILTATVYPEDAENKEVDFAVGWLNAQSEWASGKTVTDSVTITQLTDGGLTATLECKGAFAEQIVATATSRANPEAFATADVHYVQRVLGYELEISNSQNQAVRFFQPTSESTEQAVLTNVVKANFNVTVTTTVNVNIKKSDVYTKASEETANYFTITATDSLKTAVTAAGLNADSIKNYSSDDTAGFLDSVWGTAIYGNSPANRNKLINALVGYTDTVYEITLYTAEGGSSVATFSVTLDKSIIAGQKVVERLEVDKIEIIF